MAHVAQDDEIRDWIARTWSGNVSEWIDDFTSYLFREFKAIPEVAAEWDEWEEPDRLDFVIEWPIKEDRLYLLKLWAADGDMTPAQCARYEELLRLVAQQRPTLDRLLAD